MSDDDAIYPDDEDAPGGSGDRRRDSDSNDSPGGPSGMPPADEFNLGAPIEEGAGAVPDIEFGGANPDDSTAADESSESRSGEHAIVRWKEEPDENDEESLEPIKFKASDDRESEMDMTPMVDVTFLLLIFFMVTASFTLHKSIEQPPQTEDEPSTEVIEEDTEEPDYILVFVDEYNTFQIIYGDDTWECPSEQELIVNLRNIKNDATAGATPTELLVMAHGDCNHERVVMAMDAGTEVGMASIQVTMTETGPE